MKKFLIPIIAFFAFALLAIPAFVFAQNQTTVQKDEEKNGAQIITSDQTQIDGTVLGDVFALNTDFTLNGNIEGNLFTLCSSCTLNQNSHVSGSVFIVGEKVNLNGSIDGAIYLAASAITASKTFNVQREFNFAAKNTTLAGSYGRKVNGSSENITLSGTFDNDLFLKTKYLTYEPNLVVKGKNTYYAPYAATVKENNTQRAQIGLDDFNRVPLPNFWDKFATQLSFKVLSFLYLLIIGFLWVLLWREKYFATITSLKERLWPALGWGALLLLVLPTLLIVLAITVVGIPIVLIISGFAIFWAYLSTIIVAGLLGHFLMLLLNSHDEKKPYLSLFLGLIAISILYALPVIGWIFQLIAIILAFGILVLSRKEILHLKF